MEAGAAALQRLEQGDEPTDELRTAIRAGDQARADFITENVPFVVSRVLRYLKARNLTSPTLDDPVVPVVEQSAVIEDLVAEAMPALIEAVDGFDWRKGWRFTTYAWKGIDGALKRRFTKDRERPQADPRVDQGKLI
jgi:hypothetical protein